MLKKKLKRNYTVLNQNKKEEKKVTEDASTCSLFDTPFWKRFYDLECTLNADLRTLQLPTSITHAYNPVEYAAVLHCAYLRRFLDAPKKLLLVGMNPGPNGMGQTGIPFGNIKTVRDIMGFTGEVLQPPSLNPKRPVDGLQCRTEEPSGVRIWLLLQRLAGGSLDTFARQCFVHNFCPLAFFDKDGRNITPSELKGEFKAQIRDICLRTLDALIMLLKPEVVVAVGDYVFTCLRKSTHAGAVRVLKLPHPSPRALNNQNWPEKAEHMLEENDLLKYIRNEI